MNIFLSTQFWIFLWSNILKADQRQNKTESLWQWEVSWCLRSNVGVIVWRAQEIFVCFILDEMWIYAHFRNSGKLVLMNYLVCRCLTKSWSWTLSVTLPDLHQDSGEVWPKVRSWRWKKHSISHTPDLHQERWENKFSLIFHFSCSFKKELKHTSKKQNIENYLGKNWF